MSNTLSNQKQFEERIKEIEYSMNEVWYYITKYNYNKFIDFDSLTKEEQQLLVNQYKKHVLKQEN